MTQPVDEKGFQAFMLALHEYGHTGLGIKKCLAAYEAAKSDKQKMIEAMEKEKMPKVKHQKVAWNNAIDRCIEIVRDA